MIKEDYYNFLMVYIPIAFLLFFLIYLFVSCSPFDAQEIDQVNIYVPMEWEN